MNPRNQIAIASCLASVLFSYTAVSAPLKSLPGHVPAIVSKLQPSGKLAGETNLTLAIGLPLHNQGALNNLIAAIYDPSSPQYHHYLSSEEFVARFGPTQEEYDSVVQFAKASGFNVTATHEDRMLLEVTAAAMNIETAFNVNMRTYPHPTESREFYAPDVEPSIPDSLPIADISGLNNYLLPHPSSLHQKILRKHNETNGPVAYSVSMDGSGPNGTFIGSDYRQIYVPGSTLTGAGQTVGLFEFDNDYPSDISAYESAANIANPPTVSTTLLGGYNGAQGSGNGEVALDIEMAMSVAPGLQQIIVYATSSSANVILSAMASATTVKQFSSSWSYGSPPVTTMDSYFKKMQTQGQSFFEASGDSGAYASGQIPIPQDDPYITQVGGTAVLTSDTNGAWMGEIVWDATDFQYASGGGISTSYTISATAPWQSGVATSSNLASSTYRNTPDVAAVAANIFTVADQGQDEIVSGTSAAAPLWAAYTALVNQYANSVGHTNVGFLNPALYALYGRRTNIAYSANFNDITFGNNTNTSTTHFYATAGYDLCTGLGSPVGNTLMQSLVSPDGLIISPGRGFTGSGPVGGPFTISNQSVLLTNSSASSTSWVVGGAVPWLNLSAHSGTLAAASAQTISVSANAAANALPSGVYVADLWFTNLTSQQSQLRQFTLQVDQNIIHDGGFEAEQTAYWVLVELDAPGYDFVDNGGNTGYSAESGLAFFAFGASNAVAELYQPIRTVPGTPYLLSFWLSNPSGSTPSLFRAQLATATKTNVLFGLTNSGASGWQNYQFVAVATATNSFLQFLGRDDPDYLLLDEVSLVPIPAPTIVSFQIAQGSVTLTWNSMAGFQYKVESAPSLSPDQWTILNTVTASDVTATDTETVPGGAAQFYRIVMLPIAP